MIRNALHGPFMTLVRRELWEHRSLVWAPLAMALTIIVLSVLSGAMHGGVSVMFDDGDALPAAMRDVAHQRAVFGVWIGALVVPQMLVGVVVVVFYLLDCLFTERRDRSILFWKSMPVSDAKTVLSKLFVALVAMPLWIWALTMVVGVAVFAVVAAKVSGTPAAALGTWHGDAWLALQASLLGKSVVAALWYLPVAGYLLVVSVLAKRSPFVWATLPFFVLSIAERSTFGTSHVGQFVGRRLTGFFEEFAVKAGGEDAGRILGDVYARFGEFPLLASAELWLGVVAGAALVYAAIRLRRRSDDG